MDTASHNVAMPPSRRRPGMLSSGLLIALLTLEVWLYACDRFGWCGFGTRKGWAVLIATGSASVLLTLFMGWFLICMLAGRRRQFSLSSLLLLMLAVAIPLGWLTSSVQRANRQHEAIAKLKNPYQDFHYEMASAANLPVAQPPPFLERVLKREFFDDVAVIHWGKREWSTVNPAELAYLRDFQQLRRLEVYLDDPPVTEEELEQEETGDVRSQVTTAGLVNLEKLAHLEGLSLSNCSQLTDTDLSSIPALEQLTSLSLTNLSQVTDVGLNHLRGLTRLERLKLDGLTQITDAGLTSIGGLTNLRLLSISPPDNGHFSDNAIENIAELTKLETLLLDGTNITDRGMQHIGHFTQLRNLSLRGADLTDEGMSQIANLKQLEYLVLGGTVITDAGVAHLVGLTRLKCLNLKDTNIGDTSVPYLASLPNLAFLYVSGTNITQAGRAQLREHNPSLLIMSPFAGEDPLSVRW